VQILSNEENARYQYKLIFIEAMHRSETTSIREVQDEKKAGPLYDGVFLSGKPAGGG
jgi:hypothetical protein